MPQAESLSAEPAPGFFVRFFVLSWVAFFRTLFDLEFAAGVARLREGRPALPPPREPETPTKKKKKDKPAPVPAPVLRESTPEAALQLLALLQREGRLVDFLEEEVATFSDAQIGAAARVVHEGCRKALREHVPVEPVRAEEEGASIVLDAGFDARAIRLTGNVQGEPPYRGKLAHRGWRAREVKLPKTTEGHDANVLAPAEIEL
jgi:hypothetical protein